MTTRDDGRSSESDEFGLSRRDAVKGAGVLALATAAGATSPLASRQPAPKSPARPAR